MINAIDQAAEAESVERHQSVCSRIYEIVDRGFGELSSSLPDEQHARHILGCMPRILHFDAIRMLALTCEPLWSALSDSQKMPLNKKRLLASKAFKLKTFLTNFVNDKIKHLERCDTRRLAGEAAINKAAPLGRRHNNRLLLARFVLALVFVPLASGCLLDLFRNCGLGVLVL